MSLEGGVDSGKAPILLGKNQSAWLINATVRNGFVRNRPGWIQHTLDFGGSAALQLAATQGLYQGGNPHTKVDGTAELLYCVSGRQFKIDLSSYAVSELTIPGNPNSSVLPTNWFVQAERFSVIQDNQSRALIYDGATLRRSLALDANGNPEIPIGSAMAYGMGHLWLAQGTGYSAGDVVGDRTSGTPGYGYEDSVLKWDQNQYLATGGKFFVPMQTRGITALRFNANLDTTLGQGELCVFTKNGIFSTDVPVDAATWKTSDQVLQRIAMINFGSAGDRCITNVNGDLFFRAEDGARSLIYARRDFSSWGNTSISHEESRLLDSDSRQFLDWITADNFDNRYLLGASPKQSTTGVYQSSLAVLDFSPITNMLGKSPPVWEGAWTGLNLMQIWTTLVGNQLRCFALALGPGNDLQLWELTQDAQFDNGDQPISWVIETRGMGFDSPLKLKRLESADFWLANVVGKVHFRILYRPDQRACWVDWQQFEICAGQMACPDGQTCFFPANAQPQYQSRVSINQPADTCDSITGTPLRHAFEFQFRIEVTGCCEIRKFRAQCLNLPELEFGPCPPVVCT